MITVVIPTYKPREYIEDCLRSLDMQTLDKNNFEVLVILNGEREPYYSNIRQLLNSCVFNNRLFFSDIPDVCNARNVGLANAKGEYICFIDDDDKVSPDYLMSLFVVSIENPGSIVCSNFKTFDYEHIGDDYITAAYYKCIKQCKKYSLLGYRHFLSSSCGKLIPVSTIGNNRFQEGLKIGEDAYFMASISNRIKNIILTPPSAIYYRRIRPGSASRKKERAVDKLNRKWNLLVRYVRLYVNGFPHYNLPFFLSRIVAIIVK